MKFHRVVVKHHFKNFQDIKRESKEPFDSVTLGMNSIHKSLFYLIVKVVRKKIAFNFQQRNILFGYRNSLLHSNC